MKRELVALEDELLQITSSRYYSVAEALLEGIHMAFSKYSDHSCISQDLKIFFSPILINHDVVCFVQRSAH